MSGMTRVGCDSVLIWPHSHELKTKKCWLKRLQLTLKLYASWFIEISRWTLHFDLFTLASMTFLAFGQTFCKPLATPTHQTKHKMIIRSAAFDRYPTHNTEGANNAACGVRLALVWKCLWCCRIGLLREIWKCWDFSLRCFEHWRALMRREQEIITFFGLNQQTLVNELTGWHYLRGPMHHFNWLKERMKRYIDVVKFTRSLSREPLQQHRR